MSTDSEKTIAELEAELALCKRGGKTLGQTVEWQCRAALDATGLHHIIGEDGDGDWALVWEHLAELRPRAEAAEAKVAEQREQLRVADYCAREATREAVSAHKGADELRALAAMAEARGARVEAAIRLLGNEHITPEGARILRAALDADA